MLKTDVATVVNWKLAHVELASHERRASRLGAKSEIRVVWGKKLRRLDTETKKPNCTCGSLTQSRAWFGGKGAWRSRLRAIGDSSTCR